MIGHVFIDRCTGCGTCVEACPTHVFDRAADGTAVIARLDQCQTCFMCELYCDADALYVDPDQRMSAPVDPAMIAATGELGSLRRGYRWTGGASEPDSLDQFWRLGPLLREGAEIAAARYWNRQRDG